MAADKIAQERIADCRVRVGGVQAITDNYAPLYITADDTFATFKNIIYIPNGPAFVLIC